MASHESDIGALHLQPEVESGFSGVVAVHRDGELIAGWARGLADRTFTVPNTIDTRFGLASVTKTFTATVVLSLIAEGSLTLDTTARSVLGDDLPLIAGDVTVDHLLTHRSGIGDYLDEEVDDLAPLTLPVQELATSADYLRVVDGYPTKFAAGERFSYCNGGYVVLGLIAERVAGRPYADLVARRVFEPAGMMTADLARSDALASRTATGYRDDGTSNIFHIPVVGFGDGGAHATTEDLHAFWRALFAGELLPAELVATMTDAVSPDAEGALSGGRGLWRKDRWTIMQGGDHGVSAWSQHDAAHCTTISILANIELAVMRRADAVAALIAL